MTGNPETGLLFGDVGGHQGDRDVDVHQDATSDALDMVMAINTLVEPARLIRKGKFLDQVMFSQQMESPVYRAVGDRRIPASDPFEDLACSQVTLGDLNLSLDNRPLGCVPVGCLNFCRHVSVPSLAERPAMRSSAPVFEAA
jgi:hypothetical protein